MKSKFAATLALVALFVLLFYKNTWGLNLFILQTILLIWLLQIKGWKLTKAQWILASLTLITSISTFWNHNLLGLFVSSLQFLCLSTALSFESFRSIHIAFSSLLKIPHSYVSFIVDGFQLPTPRVWKKLQPSRGVIYIYSSPLVFLFIVLYSYANPAFGESLNGIWTKLGDFFNAIFSTQFWEVLLYVVLGLFLLIPVVYSRIPDSYKKIDIENLQRLTRVLLSKNSKIRSLNPRLRLEYKTGIFLMFVLNALLVLLLYFEIRDVWFGFQWKGEMLKGFVHQGIWILLVSIVISMGVALFFFRGLLNFFSQNKWLVRFTYLWLGLNALLTVSVGVRTWYYIEHFALAYKRIGLIFFLVAVLAGLYSVVIKIYYRYNTQFLLRFNSWVVFVLLSIMSWVNWDSIIASYNLSRENVAFVHLDYMINLSDKTLPLLVKSPEELKDFQLRNKRMLSISPRLYSRSYLQADTYGDKLTKRIGKFMKEWENKNYLEWNPAQARAYEELRKMGYSAL